MTANTQTDNSVPTTLEIKWRALLQSVKPVYGNADADRIAEIMQSAMNGEDTTERKLQFIAEKETSDSMANPEDDEDTMSNASSEDDNAMSAEERDVWDNWGSAGGPPLPGRRFIGGEWKTVPYAEWTEADKALAEEIYGHDSEDEEERVYEEWLAKRDQWLQKQSKETLIMMVLMDNMEKEDYIDKHMDDMDSE